MAQTAQRLGWLAYNSDTECSHPWLEVSRTIVPACLLKLRTTAVNSLVGCSKSERGRSTQNFASPTGFETDVNPMESGPNPRTGLLRRDAKVVRPPPKAVSHQQPRPPRRSSAEVRSELELLPEPHLLRRSLKKLAQQRLY